MLSGTVRACDCRIAKETLHSSNASFGEILRPLNIYSRRFYVGVGATQRIIAPLVSLSLRGDRHDRALVRVGRADAHRLAFRGVAFAVSLKVIIWVVESWIQVDVIGRFLCLAL